MPGTKLTAGGFEREALGEAEGGIDTGLCQGVDKMGGGFLGRGFVPEFRDGAEGNKVAAAGKAAQEGRQRAGLLRGVVETGNQGIFKRDDTVCFFNIIPAGIQNSGDGVAMIDRH